MKKMYLKRIEPNIETLIAWSEIEGKSNLMELAIDQANINYKGIPERDNKLYKSYIDCVSNTYQYLKEVHR